MPIPDAANSVTSLSLLARLKEDPRGQPAWDEFIQRYSPRIRNWCRAWGLQDADVEDVTQDVLLQLARQMHRFEYDPSGKFRSWLKTVAWRAWVDFLKSRNRNPALPGTEAMFERLNSVEAKDDLMRRLDEAADKELLEIALDNVRKRVKPHTFEAFRLMTFEHLSGEETSKRLGIKVGTVFVAKSRIDKMLTDEFNKLEQEL